MSRAEKFISEYTRNCSNEYLTDSKPDGLGGYISRRKFTPWLSIDEARKAVEIAREEMIDWIDKHWREYINVYADGVVCFGHWKNDFKQAMKDE